MLEPVNDSRAARRFDLIRVLDMDPDLGSTLPEQRLAEARERLVARVHVVSPGPWPHERLRQSGPGSLGLLVLEGVIARELLLRDNVSTELLGEGDLVRPWQAHGPSRLLRSEARWTVLQQARIAVLGPTFATAVAHYPEVNAVLIERVTERCHRLGLAQAICQLNGVDHRVQALLWHLAERWGRITGQGVVIPLALPHRIIAQLVGARRPTVSTALTRLVERGTVARLPDGGWLLRGSPVGVPTAEASRVVRMRRRRFQPGTSRVAHGDAAAAT
jgi:CRP/FNR family transcriptional regulator, cyclic AMP receptor protein